MKTLLIVAILITLCALEAEAKWSKPIVANDHSAVSIYVNKRNAAVFVTCSLGGSEVCASRLMIASTHAKNCFKGEYVAVTAKVIGGSNPGKYELQGWNCQQIKQGARTVITVDLLLNKQTIHDAFTIAMLNSKKVKITYPAGKGNTSKVTFKTKGGLAASESLSQTFRREKQKRANTPVDVFDLIPSYVN